MTNILDFPVEILFKIYQELDLKSKGRLRKTCHTMNDIFINPKNVISNEIVEKWDNQYKKIVGLSLLQKLYQGKKIILSNPMGKYHTCFYLYPIDKNQNKLLFSIDYEVYQHFPELMSLVGFVHHSQNYTNGQDGGLFGVYQLDPKVQNIKENLDHHCKILYELIMLWICKPQKKNKKIVSRYQFVDWIKRNRQNIFKNFSLIKIFSMNTEETDDGNIYQGKKEIKAQDMDQDMARGSNKKYPDLIQSKIDLSYQECIQDAHQMGLDPSEAFEFYKRIKIV